MPEASIPSSQLKTQWLPSWSPRMPQLTVFSVYVFIFFRKRKKERKKNLITSTATDF